MTGVNRLTHEEQQLHRVRICNGKDLYSSYNCISTDIADADEIKYTPLQECQHSLLTFKGP